MPPRLPASVRALQFEPLGINLCPSCRSETRGSRTRHDIHWSRSSAPATRNLYTHALSSARSRRVKQAPTSRSPRRTYANPSFASTTAINTSASAPPEFQELHRRLLALQETAPNYTDLSRIQLALKSLESQRPVLRIALLGVGANGAIAARRLARVLLSDPLSDEQAWERTLVAAAQDGRSLLLRYGDAEDVVPNSPLVQTIHVPSPFLRRSQVEFLITDLNTDANEAHRSQLEEATSVPLLTTPTSAGGRVGFVRYPVHKTVLVAEGVAGAVQFGRLPQSLSENDLITSALSLPLRPSTAAPSAEVAIGDTAVDVDLATNALELFRADNANGAKFSSQWQTSRISELAQWIAGPNDDATLTRMRPAVTSLIESILVRASTAVGASETRENAKVVASTVSEAQRKDLQEAITEWTSWAHHDLQSNLADALASSSWKRTVWWRLFWRIDDVSVSASDILRQKWLAKAEQLVAFLSGRIRHSGLATDAELSQTGLHPIVDKHGEPLSPEQYKEQQARIANLVEALHLPPREANMVKETGVNALLEQPWPQTINLSRQFIINKLVPRLHVKAQALLFTSLSTITGSAALGVWFYIATAGVGLYEAGAIAALGLVYSLRRLQKRWGKERDDFAVALREDGRKVLAEVEAQLRRIVRDNQRPQVRPTDIEEWTKTRLAIDSCQDALDRVQGGKQ